MKIVVIGGTGLIGSKLVKQLREHEVDERTLVPGNDARLGEIRFEDWLSQPALRK